MLWIDAMSRYCVYLRKSRADSEAEARGEGETLARHEKILLDLSRSLHINIETFYKEIVSGESISSRPVMQHLLKEVEQGKWTGVLVVEVERLARGDTMDQGLVAQSFKCSNTKIITPLKTYDPLNEYDEEYFEFGLFMSRREYKTINRRLQRGRLESAKEGKYVGSIAPYGYKRKKLCQDKGYTLEIHPDEAPVIQLIYDLYCKKRLGFNKIASELNCLCVKPRKNHLWSESTIRGILTNPVYIGKIRWKNRPLLKKLINGAITTTRPRTQRDNILLFDGLHPPIIEEVLYNKAKDRLSKKTNHPVKYNSTLKNPLAGLIRCSQCGCNMTRKPYQDRPDTLICKTSGCKTVSSSLILVEQHLLTILEPWFNHYEIRAEISPSVSTDFSMNVYKVSLSRLEKELATYQLQLDQVHNLLEQGVYNTKIYNERSFLLTNKIEDHLLQIEKLQEIQPTTSTDLSLSSSLQHDSPKTLGQFYNRLPNATAKNHLLKKLFSYALYTKGSSCRWHQESHFHLELIPLDIIMEQKS